MELSFQPRRVPDGQHRRVPRQQRPLDRLPVRRWDAARLVDQKDDQVGVEALEPLRPRMLRADPDGIPPRAQVPPGLTLVEDAAERHPRPVVRRPRLAPQKLRYLPLRWRRRHHHARRMTAKCPQHQPGRQRRLAHPVAAPHRHPPRPLASHRRRHGPRDFRLLRPRRPTQRFMEEAVRLVLRTAQEDARLFSVALLRHSTPRRSAPGRPTSSRTSPWPASACPRARTSQEVPPAP